MRLLLVGPATSIHLAKWANALASAYEVHIATLHQPAGQQYRESVIVHSLGEASPARYFLAAPALRRLIRRLRPDIIHTHYATGYGTLTRFATMCDETPRVLSVWGADVYDSPALGPHWRYLVQGNLASAHIVTSTGRAMASVTRELCRLPRLEIIPFGVDLRQFSPGDRGPSSTVTVGSIRTMHPDYGIDILIQAFAQATSRVSVPMRLLLHGSGPQEPELRALVAKLGLDSLVTFADAMPHADVAPALRSLDIYAALSRTESFGVGIIEAMAVGVPVVVSDADGPAEVTPDEVAGIVVPRLDVRAAADAIVRLASDAALRERMGAAGREHVLQHYSWDACVTALSALYDDILRDQREHVN